METIERDYSPKGVRFYYVYKALAHPEYDGYVTPFTLEERLLHVAEARRRLGSRVRWLADTMDNDLSRALGGVPNAELLIDPEGRVARRRSWSDPEALRGDLEELLGAVERPTRVADLDLPEAPPPTTVATGIVPRVEVAGRMRALAIEPALTGEEHPFYAKLRAEADEGFFRDGRGKLYLGFHLDPLYEVHWNNLAKPLELEVAAPAGVRVAPSRAKAPKVEEKADADPREFLLDLTAEQRGEPLDLTVRYFACDNADTFCVPVTQSYRVHLQADPHGGRAMARGGGRGGAGGGDMASRMMRFDTDGDGRISREEAPERMLRRFDLMDADGDGAVDAAEIEAMMQRRRRSRG